MKTLETTPRAALVTAVLIGSAILASQSFARARDHRDESRGTEQSGTFVNRDSVIDRIYEWPFFGNG